MPEITLLGWFHTVLGGTALISGGYALANYKEITLQHRGGQIYLTTTLITALSALGIYQHGGFGVAHVLAILTLLALAVGTVAAATDVFGKFSRYLQALSFSATLLFHCIPAVTDGLLRLPVGDPILSSLEDPILKKCFLALLIMYLVGVGLQLAWIHRQQSAK